jgi:hypothetical protein
MLFLISNLVFIVLALSATGRIAFNDIAACGTLIFFIEFGGFNRFHRRLVKIKRCLLFIHYYKYIRII